MTNQTMSPCCARAHAKYAMEKANLVRVARVVSYRESKGQPITGRWATAIPRAREGVSSARENLINHEASHAGRGA